MKFNFHRTFQRCGIWLIALSAIGMTMLTAQENRKDPFAEEFTYTHNKRMGEKLSVIYPNSPTENTRLTEVTLLEERYYNRDNGKYEKRFVGIITGMGLGSTGLKLVLDDQKQLSLLKDCLEKFQNALSEYSKNEDLIREQTEDWMGESWQALAKGRNLGEVYFYPSKKKLNTEFNWDFELERVWLSMGSRVIIDYEVVPYIQHILKRLDAYKDAFFGYRKTLETKNKEIDSLLGLDS